MRTRRASAALVALLSVSAANTVSAQPVAGSFEQLRARVAVGDTVIVTDVTGHEVQGRITDLSPSSLALADGRTQMKLVANDVATISRRDSRWNGTLMGAGVGFVLGALVERALAQEYGRDDVGYGTLAFPGAAVGAGIGFAVDSLLKGRRLIYSRPRATAATLVSPDWSAGRKGIRVSLCF